MWSGKRERKLRLYVMCTSIFLLKTICTLVPSIFVDSAIIRFSIYLFCLLDKFSNSKLSLPNSNNQPPG